MFPWMVVACGSPKIARLDAETTSTIVGGTSEAGVTSRSESW